MGLDLDRKAPVPYFKCVPCKVRVPATGVQMASTDRSCPSCGLALEPAAELTELVGFRSVAEPQFDIDRWLDEGGSLGPGPLAEAVAVRLPFPGSR